MALKTQHVLNIPSAFKCCQLLKDSKIKSLIFDLGPFFADYVMMTDYKKKIIYTQGGLANEDRGYNMNGISCHLPKIAPRTQNFGF